MNETLLLSQKNDVFQCIVNWDISPTLFSWKESFGANGNKVSVLEYNNSDFYFIFDSDGNFRISRY